jgi:ribonuclease I
MQRLRHSLRDYFPAALEAFTDLAAPDTLELLAKAPDPASAAKLTTAQITAALKRARRRAIPAKAAAIQAALRSERPGPARRRGRRLRRHRPGGHRSADRAQ